MPAALMFHDVDPRKALLDKIGPIDDHEVFHNQVLVAVYIAPQKMASGLWRPETNVDEDRYQSKVGLVLKMGPRAFQPDEKWTWPSDMSVGDWVYFKTSNGFMITVNGDRDNLCRMLDDVAILGRVQHPDVVW